MRSAALSTVEDYRIVAKLRNNRILTLIERTGLSVPKFCKRHGISYPTLAGLIAMTEPAKGARGQWRKSAVDLASALRMLPEDLFNDRQETADFSQTTLVRKTSDDRVLPPPVSLPMLSGPDSELERRDALRMLMDSFSERTKDVLARRYGFDDYAEHSLEEIAWVYGLTGEAVRQILLKAHRTMRFRAHTAGLTTDDFFGGQQ